MTDHDTPAAASASSSITLASQADPAAPGAPANLRRRGVLGATGALLAGGLLPLWLPDALALDKALPDTEQGAQRGGALDAVVHPEPPTLAFFINTATPGRTVVSKIFDGLLDYGPDLKPRPQLAESVEVSPDGLSVRLRLRRNVSWHDGKPFTAADVKYSAEEIWPKYAPTARRVFQHLRKVEAPDSHTVVLTLAKPTPVILNALDVVAAPVLPKHLYAGTDVPNNPYNNKPVGTGPFVFREWVRGQHIALERFDKYWAPGLPYLDRITFKIIPDVAGRAAALETGAVQYGERNPVTFADADRLARSPKLVVSTGGYNGFAGWLWLIPNLRDPILGNLKVRQALLHAIDRDALTRTVWGGYAAPATGPVSSLLKTFYTKDTQQYPYDKKKAEALLDEAGFPRKPDGWRFKLNHDYIPFGDDYRRTGEFVRQSLRAIGIDVTLRGQDLAAWTKNVFSDYNFQLVSSWGINWQDPQIGVEQHYWSKAEAKGTPWQNASGYASAEADRLLEAAQVERDPARRVELYRQFQGVAQRDLALLNLFEFRWFGVWDKRLRNVTDTFDHSQNNFARVWLATK
ncbi:ABC transporter substrate-binding protein [Cupriavidus sp. USMAHM13]|uniref:ABC transporter substrate-binding protein n=1 Tax=Cupriavidus malaysiensis TaxID=367825 RepID=A0ABN4TY31_9BURK|nr:MULTISPECIES: ABC transporter substrate-binding protein [Cupriavidus]AOZ03168.1 ABC transporter substrate-binding protein [Cupriavidus sp. USMAHM13]AOZ09469.1 ABC transporter substrate-binding protein [Cupriavidus malaysiensis]